jgi:DNA invertase Pin-like site-specific DNA recombinase
MFEGEYSLYEDKQSAWKDNKERFNLERLKKDIRQGKIKDLYVWDWDRLFRNRKKLKEFFQFCVVYKCQIHSFRQGFFETFYKIPAPFDEIMKELFLNLLGWMAEDESTKKSDRIRLAVRRENGKPTKSYKGNKWGRKALDIDKKIILLSGEGKSIREICKEVYYWDKSRHKKFVSVGYVQGVIKGCS